MAKKKDKHDSDILDIKNDLKYHTHCKRCGKTLIRIGDGTYYTSPFSWKRKEVCRGDCYKKEKDRDELIIVIGTMIIVFIIGIGFGWMFL